MQITEYLKNNILYLDGGMGTLLQAQGLAAGELPERWNITRPEVITEIHKSYYDAGSNVVNTNTFGANSFKFASDELDAIIKAAVENARNAARESRGEQPKWVALDIGPTGRMLAPFGDLDFEDTVSVFAETVKLGVKYGVDLVVVETMNDSYETKAALLAVKENSDLPVFVTNAYGASGRTMTGADPATMVAILEGMGANAIGLNCSLGPKALGGVVSEYLKYASVPVILKPNAGLPKVVNGKVAYDVLPDEFAEDVADQVKSGVRIVGGCCGTTPEYISALVNSLSNIAPLEISQKNIPCVSSYNHAVELGNEPVQIGEQINPTGEKLKAEDVDDIVDEALAKEEDGVHILDVNFGCCDVDSNKVIKDAVCEIQSMVNLPLLIDSADPVALETALRCYNGKAMINAVNGKKESMDTVFPLVKKYGGVVVALTLDEKGIPTSAESGLAIAEKILAEAQKYGIEKKNIIFNPISDDKDTLNALIKERLGCKTLSDIKA